jgi:hypothetical protein
MQEKKVADQIVRHGAPCKLDQAEYATQCVVNKGSEFELYIQVSQNEDNPDWEFIGKFPNDTSENHIKEILDLKI